MNIDLSAVIDEHIRTGAYITMVAKKVNAKDALFGHNADVLGINEEGRVTSLSYTAPTKGSYYANTYLMVVSRADLQNIVSDSIAHRYTSFSNDIITRQLKKKNIRAYIYDGFCASVTSFESYFNVSMKMLEDDVRADLFANRDRQIFTKVRNSAPTKYDSTAKISNSMIADGCTIDGEVENSIIFRGVHVGKGTVVKNCILLQDTYVGVNAQLNCVVTDKNVVIKDDRMLSGHETRPYFIGKGETV
jgi:glucose-1-phosphate adenylyltransferase